METDTDRVDLRTLVAHDRSVPATTTAEALQAAFEQMQVDFVAVLDGENVLGLCSRRHLARQLSSRYGFALYARQPATEFLMHAPLLVPERTPITDVFRTASGRDPGDFYDDVALVNGLGRYLGMIPMITLVRLQTRFLLRNNEMLDKSRLEIAAKNRVLEEDILMARKVQLAMQPQSHAPLSANGLTLRLAHRYKPAGQAELKPYAISNPNVRANNRRLPINIRRAATVRPFRHLTILEIPSTKTNTNPKIRSIAPKSCMFVPNVDMIRSNDGATRAPHEACLRKESDPRIG